VMPSALLSAVATVASSQRPFLMAGRRWDLDVTEALEFDDPGWVSALLNRAARQGVQRAGDWIDYFAFSRGLFTDIPALVIGRVGWDNWLVWRARAQGALLVDASQSVFAVHQNHDYGYHPQGKDGVWNDAVASENIALAGGPQHLYTMDDATHALTPDGLRRKPSHRLAPARRAWRRLRSRIWFGLLGLTRPVRHALGLRQDSLLEFFRKSGIRRASR